MDTFGKMWLVGRIRYNSAQNNIPSTIENSSGTYSQDFTFALGGNYQIYARAKNVCGLGTTETLNILVSNHCGLGFNVSPNPTNGILQITSADEGINIKEVNVCDKTGRIRKQFVYNAKVKTVTINISALPADVYYLQVYDGTKWEGKTIIKL